MTFRYETGTRYEPPNLPRLEAALFPDAIDRVNFAEALRDQASVMAVSDREERRGHSKFIILKCSIEGNIARIIIPWWELRRTRAKPDRSLRIYSDDPIQPQKVDELVGRLADGIESWRRDYLEKRRQPKGRAA